MKKGEKKKKVDNTNNDKTKKVFIVISAIVIFLTIAGIVCAILMYNAQYNSKGVSHFLVITIDPNKERVQIGRLDDYNVYVEGLSEYNFRTFNAENLSVKEAIDKKLVSVDEWKKYAFSTKKDNDSLILVFENYEIALTGDECLIRPRS